MTTQLELPFYEVALEPCLTLSNGVQCRYFAHLGGHSFGGGLGDPVEPRHCKQATSHEPHAYEHGKGMAACSGAGYAINPKVMCADDQRIHPAHRNCPGRDHNRCTNADPHGPHGWGEITRPWFCRGTSR